MSVIGPVQSRCHEGSPVGKISLRWEGFVEKVGFMSPLQYISTEMRPSKLITVI